MRKLAPLMLAGLISCNSGTYTPESTTEKFLDAVRARDTKTIELLLSDESYLKKINTEELGSIYDEYNLDDLHENLESMETGMCDLPILGVGSLEPGRARRMGDTKKYMVVQPKGDTIRNIYGTGLVLEEKKGNWKITGLCIPDINPGRYDQCVNESEFCPHRI